MTKSKEKMLKVFENLSIILTGFSRADIVGTGLLHTYWDTIISELGKETFDSILSAFQRIKIADPEQLSSDELRDIKDLVNSETYKFTITQIIQLWYLGEWIDDSNSNQNRIISSQSYLEGLIWKAIAAHPMGGKQPGYGTWGFPSLTFSSEPKTN